MPLYYGTIDLDIVVWAEDDRLAEKIMHDHIDDELELLQHKREFLKEEIESVEELPPEWLKCIPYGDSNDKTCQQILEEYVMMKRISKK